jgi:hypothetical protein
MLVEPTGFGATSATALDVFLGVRSSGALSSSSVFFPFFLSLSRLAW